MTKLLSKCSMVTQKRAATMTQRILCMPRSAVRMENVSRQLIWRREAETRRFEE